MTTTMRTKVKLEAPNGDSLQTRLNRVCKYYATYSREYSTDEEVKRWVRESVVALVNMCDVVIERKIVAQ